MIDSFPRLLTLVTSAAVEPQPEARALAGREVAGRFLVVAAARLAGRLPDGARKVEGPPVALRRFEGLAAVAGHRSGSVAVAPNGTELRRVGALAADEGAGRRGRARREAARGREGAPRAVGAGGGARQWGDGAGFASRAVCGAEGSGGGARCAGRARREPPRGREEAARAVGAGGGARQWGDGAGFALGAVGALPRCERARRAVGARACSHGGGLACRAVGAIGGPRRRGEGRRRTGHAARRAPVVVLAHGAVEAADGGVVERLSRWAVERWH